MPCTKTQHTNTISHSNAPSSPVCGRESYMYTIQIQKHTHTFMTVSVCLFIVAYSRRIIVSLVMNFVCTIVQKFESLLTKDEKFNDRKIEKKCFEFDFKLKNDKKLENIFGAPNQSRSEDSACFSWIKKQFCLHLKCTFFDVL